MTKWLDIGLNAKLWNWTLMGGYTKTPPTRLANLGMGWPTIFMVLPTSELAWRLILLKECAVRAGSDLLFLLQRKQKKRYLVALFLFLVAPARLELATYRL